MFVGCDECGWSGDVPRRVGAASSTRYTCRRCRRPVTTVSIFAWAEWVERHADRREEQRRRGLLGTRLQSTVESDRDICSAGLAAELAACLILAPSHLADWFRNTEAAGPNRGSDLPAGWFADGRAVEVKYTSCRRGHLLVRPPRATPGPMRREYLDDSIYILMTGSPYTFTVLGWAGRSDLLRRGTLDPVPVRGRQRQCWGIHVDRLNPMHTLFPLLATRRCCPQNSRPRGRDTMGALPANPQ